MAISPSWRLLPQFANHTSSTRRKDPQPVSIRFPKHLLRQTQIKPVQPMRKKCATVTDILRLMDNLQLPIDTEMYVSLLKECTRYRDAVHGTQVHSHIEKSGIRPGLLLTNRLLLMYASCGRLDLARITFDEMPMRDSVSWASMIVGHAETDASTEALRFFVEMHKKGMQPSPLVLVAVLKACVHQRDLEFGKQVHGLVLKMGDVENMFVGSSFIDFYGRFGSLESARMFFDQSHCLDTAMWAAMIMGYCREHHFDEAVKVFKEMNRAGEKNNNYTISTILLACGKMGNNDEQLGKQVHGKAIKAGVEADPFVHSSLVNMYGKCGLLGDARKAFEIISERRNLVCWNAMLSCYTQHGCCNNAIKFLYEMKAAGFEPQESMLTKVRLACAS